MAIDLIGKKDEYCQGLYAFDKDKKSVITIKADIVILASGGASKVYQYTTNPTLQLEMELQWLGDLAVR